MTKNDSNEQFELTLGPTDTLVYETTNDKYSLRFVATNEGMELSVSAAPYQADSFISAERILGMLPRLNVSGHADPEALQKFCAAVALGETVEGIVFLRGTPPQNGTDQRLTFMVKAFSAEAAPPEKYDENKDYHHLNLFENINKNQLVAEVIKETQGVSGKNIFGANLAPMPGEKLEKPLKAGQNIVTDSSGYKFFAKVDGMVVYGKSSQTIAVSDIYKIEGNVDYTTGNIDFIGAVEVYGDVVDNYDIKANKGIIVRQHVGDCLLESEGNIIILGMDATGRGHLNCGGTLKAKYLHGVTAECSGNIMITTEAVNCELHTEMSILAKTGAIIGGQSVALKGFEVQTLGSDADMKTYITAGISILMQNAIKDVKERVKVLTKSMYSMNKSLNPFVTNPKKLFALNKSDQDKVKELAERFRT